MTGMGTLDGDTLAWCACHTSEPVWLAAWDSRCGGFGNCGVRCAAYVRDGSRQCRNEANRNVGGEPACWRHSDGRAYFTPPKAKTRALWCEW